MLSLLSTFVIIAQRSLPACALAISFLAISTLGGVVILYYNTSHQNEELSSVDSMPPRQKSLAQFPSEEEGPMVVDHQKHPQETPELIAEGLARFEEELGHLSPKERRFVDQALEQAPLAKDDDFRLTFLRTEVFDAKLAAQRFAKFWETRLDLFGPDHAFQPLTQKAAILNDDDGGETLRLGYVRTVPHNPRLFVIDPARTVKNYDIEAVARTVRYVMETGTFACPDNSRLGCVCIVDLCTIRWFDRKLVTRLSNVIENCIPLRTTQVLLINPPSVMVKYFVNLLRLCMKPKLRNRIHVVTYSEKLKRLAGVTLEDVAALDHAAWLEKMARKEEGRMK